MTAGADRDDDIALAGEYVLGLLDQGEARAFEARLGREPQLRALVARFNEDFVTLTDRIAPVPPPASVKAGLERRLFPAPARKGLSVLRLLFGGLTGALAVLVLVVALPFLTPQIADLRAEIRTEGDALVVLADLDLETGVLEVRRAAGGPLPGRSLQLWLIPKGETAPISLGVIDPETTTQLVPADLVPRFQDGALAISDEPQGGSPTGSPTNVLGAGAVTLL